MSASLNMAVLVESFREDAVEHMAGFEQALLKLERQPGDEEAIHTAFRAVHTMKGSGGIFKYDELTRFTHGFENLLDSVREGKLRINDEIIQLLFKAHDHMQHLLAHYGEEKGAMSLAELQGVSNVLLVSVNRLLANPGAEGPKLMPAVYRVVFKPGLFKAEMSVEGAFRYLLRHSDVKAIRLDTASIPSFTNYNSEEAALAFEVTFGSEIAAANAEEAMREAFEFFLAELTIEPLRTEGAAATVAAGNEAQPATVAQKSGSSIRIDSSKLDDLIKLVGELVMKNGNLHQVAFGMQMREIMKPISDVSRLVENIRELAMNLRMVPIGGAFRKVERLVRDLANDSGKLIRVSFSGEETELDKNVIEKLNDPLVHIIRNAVDHGLESGADRVASGKEAEGSIVLSAHHEGGTVVVEIRDDGRGLNVDKIRQRAIEKGIASADREYSTSEIHNFIFHPGFSTAESVSEISGRGVGMDVVKKNIDALRGKIHIESVPGEGMTIRIALPLTLAIIGGFLVRSGRQKFIIPLDAVKECIDFKTAPGGESPHQNHLFNLRGSVLPYIRLSSVFSLEQTANERESLVVVEQSGRRVGVLIDEPLGEHQTVVKPLTGFLSGIKGLGGATILGSGDMALIVDLIGLLEILDERKDKNK